MVKSKLSKQFSGFSTILPALFDGNSYVYNEGGGSMQFVTIIDNEFRVPVAFQNQMTHDSNFPMTKIKTLVLLHDNKYRLLAKNLSEFKVKQLLDAYSQLYIEGLDFRILDQKDADKLIKNKEGLTPYDLGRLRKDHTKSFRYVSGDIIDKTVLDPEFSNVHNQRTAKFSGLTEMVAGAEGKSYRTGADFNETTLDAEGFRIPKITKENLNLKTTKMSRFNDDLSDRDIWEFDAWIKNKNIIPSLLATFKSETEYEDYMINAQKAVTFSMDESNNITELDFLEFNNWLDGTEEHPRLLKEFDTELDYEDYMLKAQAWQTSEQVTFSLNYTTIPTVTEKDKWEFNSWIKSDNIVPRLLKEFDSEDEYEDFMINQSEDVKFYTESEDEEIEPTKLDQDDFIKWKEDKTLPIPNLSGSFKSENAYILFMNEWIKENLTVLTDPAIIGNQNKKHVTNNGGKNNN